MCPTYSRPIPVQRQLIRALVMEDFEPKDLYSEPFDDEQDLIGMIAAFHQAQAAKGNGKGQGQEKSAKVKGQEKSAKVKKINKIKPAKNNEGSSGYGGRGSGPGNGGGSAGGGGGAITV